MKSIKNSKFNIPYAKEYVLSMLSGVESGLATTTAIIGGLTISETSRRVVVLSAVITMTVQAWNSAVSTMSLGHTEDQLDHPYANSQHYAKYLANALIQFTAHIIAGLLPIAPLLFIQDRRFGLLTSISLAVLLLYIIGYNKGKILKTSRLRSSFELIIPALLVILIGIAAGLIVRIY